MRTIFFICILLCIAGCTEKRNAKSGHVTAYYEGFKNSDYNRIKSTISDSLTIIEGDYILAFTPEDYYDHFKWDSVFRPVYTLIDLKNEQEHVVATVTVHSLRFEFLKNNPLTCRHRFYFESGKISKIETLDCEDVNWELWQKERDALVNWVKLNHPELDGFINDLSMEGAIDYLHAITWYKKRKVNVTE